jgi:hypothetical protein
VQAPAATSDSFFGQTTYDANEETKKKGKRPWVKATVKSSSAANESVSWSQVSVLFRSYRTNQGSGVAAMLVIRVDNGSGTVLNGLSIDLKDYGSVSFGTLSPGASAESDKVGPFAYSANDAAQEIKGSLKTHDSSVSVKLYLPVSFHFSPEENISLDQVAQELESSNWSSNSMKLDLGSVKKPEDVKDILCSFVRAAEVDGSAMTPATGTYAARTSSHERVRMLVKVKESSVKVDIKCTNSSLTKALAFDIKRLVLV